MPLCLVAEDDVALGRAARPRRWWRVRLLRDAEVGARALPAPMAARLRARRRGARAARCAGGGTGDTARGRAHAVAVVLAARRRPRLPQARVVADGHQHGARAGGRAADGHARAARRGARRDGGASGRRGRRAAATKPRASCRRQRENHRRALGGASRLARRPGARSAGDALGWRKSWTESSKGSRASCGTSRARRATGADARAVAARRAAAPPKF